MSTSSGDAPLPSFPFPPSDLLQRTGTVDPSDPERDYDQMGTNIRLLIDGMLPATWSWRGARVLDFGCGAGRVLRHFAGEAEHAEFWGCDIDVPSIEWMQRNLNPPFRAVGCSEEPGLPFADDFLSLIYAISVFTHLTDHATGWLLELHRTLADGGLLMLTFLGEGMINLINEPWDEDRIGFNATHHGTSWDHGGPLTFISPWWIREHWGRAFEIVELRPCTLLDQEGKPAGHGLALLRKRPGHFSAADIDEPAPNEPREIRALQHNVRQLSNELMQLRQQLANQIAETARHAEAEASARKAEIEAKDAELVSLRADLTNRVLEVQELRDVAAESRAEAAAQRAALVRARQEAAERDTTIERMRGEITSLIARPPSEALVSTRQTGTTIDQLFNNLRFIFKSKLIMLADRARDASEWAVAAHYYRIALDRNPNRPEIWIQYGHVLKDADRLSSAEQAYRQAIARAPTLAEPYRYLGDVLSAQKKRDDAVTAYLQAQSLDPTSPHALSGLRKLGWSEKDSVAVEAISD